MADKVVKTDEEWRALLSEEQFEVCRNKGTERAFTGALVDCKDPGMYVCSCCEAELFASDTKFDSGTGWPSFSEPADGGNVEEHPDHSHGMSRVEVTCSRCGAHLGHVFPDGPASTGQRYCINSVSLAHKPRQAG